MCSQWLVVWYVNQPRSDAEQSSFASRRNSFEYFTLGWNLKGRLRNNCVALDLVSKSSLYVAASPRNKEASSRGNVPYRTEASRTSLEITGKYK